MTIKISKDLLRQIQDYLRSQADKGDREAQQLLIQVLTLLLEGDSSPAQTGADSGSAQKIQLDFGKKLFDTWQELANEQVGDNFWSYPIALEDLAEAMGISVERFVGLVAPLQIANLQLIQGRGANHKVGNLLAASLTFHPKSQKTSESQSDSIQDASRKETKPTAKSSTKEKVTFRVGDRVQVNANRPQYVNQVGTVDQVISVSCRVKLDNGWSAFLPNHCLDKLPN